MQTRTVRQIYGAAAALCLAGSMMSDPHAASPTTERSAMSNQTQAASHAAAENVRSPQEWRLVVRLWHAAADRRGPARIQWVVNTYRNSLDCQHALQRRVNGIHPEVERRSNLVCVRG